MDVTLIYKFIKDEEEVTGQKFCNYILREDNNLVLIIRGLFAVQ